MKESRIIPSHYHEQLKVRDQYAISFEPGEHPGRREEYQAVDDAFARGDISAHYWNPEVGRRLRETRPRIITIDGLYTNQNQGLPDEFIWEALPTTPKLMNNYKDGIFVVQGDQLVARALTTEIPISISVAVNKKLNEEKMAPNNAISVAFPLFIMEGILGAGTLSVAPFVPGGDKHVSRRVLIKGMTAAAGLAIGGDAWSRISHETNMLDKQKQQSSMKDKASTALTEADKHKLVAKYNTLFPNPDTAWLAARNALYSLKTRGSYDTLKLPKSVPSAIIAGNNHLTGIEPIIADEKYAGEVLLNYVQGLGTIIDSFYPQNPGSATQAKKALRKFVAQTEIIQVLQPDEQLFKKNPKAAVKAAIYRGIPYEDPRVMAALAPLVE